jgi:hypothetical protein
VVECRLKGIQEDQSAKVDAELDDIKKQLKRREANIQAERQKVAACEEVLSVPRGPISEEYKQKSLQKVGSAYPRISPVLADRM